MSLAKDPSGALRPYPPPVRRALRALKTAPARDILDIIRRAVQEERDWDLGTYCRDDEDLREAS